MENFFKEASTWSFWIGLLSAGVSVVSALWSWRQARGAKAAKEDALKMMSSIQLAALAERLRSAQEHIREIAPQKVSRRGFDAAGKIDGIRKEFDSVISALPSSGSDSKARSDLRNAQGKLNAYETSLKGKSDESAWSELQCSVQDAISKLTEDSLGNGAQHD